MRWNEVFAARVERELLSQRRKEEDFEISPLIAPGLKNGALVAASGAVSSRALESLLRRYTLPVRGVTDSTACSSPSLPWPPMWRPAHRWC